MKILLIMACWWAVASSKEQYDTYSNPNPRPYSKCDAHDLIKLSACSNEVLTRLDDCKPDDLACECCALQSIDQSCYNLCPNNPSNNFLSVLFDDCASLNDVNACGLPFKKEDLVDSEGLVLKSKKVKAQGQEILSSITLKSKVSSHDFSPNQKIDINLLNQEEGEEVQEEAKVKLEIVPKRQAVKLAKNDSNQTILRMITNLLSLAQLTYSIIKRHHSMVPNYICPYSLSFISLNTLSIRRFVTLRLLVYTRRD